MTPMRQRWRAAAAEALFPGVCMVLFTVLGLLWTAIGLPPAEAVYAWLVDMYQHYGVLVVALAALAEGLVLINVYLPGSAVILLAVVANRDNPGFAAYVVLVASVVFLFAAHINYLIGFFGIHLLITRFGGRQWLETTGRWYAARGAWILLPSYVHPSVGGFTCVTCGAARLSWRRFLPIVSAAIGVWSAIWGMTAYFLSGPVEFVATRPVAIIVALGAWMIVAGAIGFFRAEHLVQQ